MLRRWRTVAGFFGLPGGPETLRAFAVFSLMLAALAAIAVQVAGRDMERLVKVHRINLGRDEGRRIGEAVRAVGLQGGRIDYARIRASRGVLKSVMDERLAEAPYLRFLELRDRFGAPIVLSRQPSVSTGDGIEVVPVPLVAGRVGEGEIRVGVSGDAIEREVESLRQGLRIKVAAASLLGLAILVAGLFYVLHLIRKNQRLEESRQHAERNAYKGLLASGLAHEIRNPLNAMNMNLQMLEEELHALPGDDAREPLDLIGSMTNEIRRLESLVNNFLLYARPSPPKIEMHDANRVLQDIATFLQADFRRHEVGLALDLEPMLPAFGFDHEKVRQALMNMLVNARQVLQKTGGSVTLRSRAGSAGEIVFEVEDTGPGMSPETAKKIFEPFYSQRRGGTGLGLPIARLMVEQHGGSVEVESEPGRGTTFRIRLPRRALSGAATESP